MYQIQSNSIGKLSLENEKTHCCSLCKGLSRPKTLARGPAGKPGSSPGAGCSVCASASERQHSRQEPRLAALQAPRGGVDEDVVYEVTHQRPRPGVCCSTSGPSISMPWTLSVSDSNGPAPQPRLAHLCLAAHQAQRAPTPPAQHLQSRLGQPGRHAAQKDQKLERKLGNLGTFLRPAKGEDGEKVRGRCSVAVSLVLANSQTIGSCTCPEWKLSPSPGS
jgi:hypothetical protein